MFIASSTAAIRRASTIRSNASSQHNRINSQRGLLSGIVPIEDAKEDENELSFLDESLKDSENREKSNSESSASSKNYSHRENDETIKFNYEQKLLKLRKEIELKKKSMDKKNSGGRSH